jgi:arsenite methyltransferase
MNVHKQDTAVKVDKQGMLKDEEIRRAVRQRYGRVAETGGSGCGAGCCGFVSTNPESISQRLGYSAADVANVPTGANMGLGCGNPQALAALKPGEVVLDLGSGGGFDCFLAARQVGSSGFVIGVDMTPEMVSKARVNAENSNYRNVEFRLGEIENLPVADNTVDAIISNCVINLSADKSRVFREAFRVLKSGGRLAVSDVVATAELPEAIRNDFALYTGCIAGASQLSEVEKMLRLAGFGKIRITPKDESRSFIRDWAPGAEIANYVVSANIEAVKE